MRIVVLKDKSKKAELTFSQLKLMGYKIEQLDTPLSLSGRTLESLPEPLPDLFLIDLGLLEGSEAQVDDFVFGLTNKLPIVVFSDAYDSELADRYIVLGVQDILLKGTTDRTTLERCFKFVVGRNQVSLARQGKEVQLKKVLEESYDAFIAMDSHWKIIEWNEIAQRTFGWTRAEVINRSISLVIPAHLRRQFMNGLKRFFLNKDASLLKASRHVVAEHRSGRLFPCEVGIFRVNENGDTTYYGFLRDITEAKRSEDELAQLVNVRTEELKRSNEELRQFAKIASHDLQEPLRAVQGFANLLVKSSKGKLDEDCQDFLDYILDGTDRMKQLIQAILAHSQLDAAASIDQATDCNSAMNEVLTDLRSSIELTDALVEVDFLPTVAVERSQVIQLFQNLISNSIKYRRTTAPQVAISVKRVTGYWLFSFRDNSIGIEQKYAEKIFDMFSRLHSKEDYPGTGMGLAICKRIVTSHGGSIWVESTEGQGCIFMFTLPAVEKKRKKLMKDVINILLVEDTPSDVRLTQEALKDSSFNYELTVVNDGVYAIEYLNKIKATAGGELPHIILLDLNMPRMNGHEVLEVIKNDSVLRPVPVILLTVSERDEDVLEALSTKMNYYLAKPVSSEKLGILVKAIHELNSQTKEGANSGASEETHIRLVLAGNPHTALIALKKLALDPEERVRCRVAENKNITEAEQRILASDESIEVRSSLCDNQSLNSSVLDKLAKDRCEDVRIAATRASGISSQLLKMLTHDENVFVADSARSALDKLRQARI